MYYSSLCIILLSLIVHFFNASAFYQDSLNTCHKAFIYKPGDYAVANTINICSNADSIPTGYLANINMAVCDDKLCANVILKICWDLAGNYARFDTLPGKPLTKFDHKRFTEVDYKKLDHILKDKNSMLRILEKEELIDKNLILKASTVDAVTGATPKSIKNAVVEGAAESSFVLWHFVNGSVKDSMRAYTLSIYSEQAAEQLLGSENFETQLFALKQMDDDYYKTHLPLLFGVIGKSVPLIKAYIIGKAPLPFSDQEQNREFVLHFSEFDSYSKSIFINRITAEKNLATIFLPLMLPRLQILDKQQLDKYISAYQKFEIPGYQELIKMLSKENMPDKRAKAY